MKKKFAGLVVLAMLVVLAFAGQVMAITVNYTFTSGTKGTYYSDYVTVSGGYSSYRWYVSSGSLPTGLRLTYSGNRATISGTPSRAGTFYFTLRVVDRYGSTASKYLYITIRDNLIINYTFKTGNVGQYYSDYVTVSGGRSPYRWSVYSGSLPSGLRLTYSGTRATIYGTPTRAGTYSFRLRAVDAAGSAAIKYFTVTVISPMTVNYTFTGGSVGRYYSDYVTVSGGTSPYRWTVASGSLPTGLRLTYSGTRATVYGTPTRAGTYYFTLRAYDRYNNTASKYLSISIISPLTINYTLRDGQKNSYYSDYVTVSGGTSPYRWNVSSGYLPTGLRLTYSGTRATVYGTPTRAGTFGFYLRVTDRYNSTATKYLSITIRDPMTINYTFAGASVGRYYSDYVTVSGGTSPYRWTVASGSLPTGLRLTYSGTRATIYGTPTRAGTYYFSLRAYDRYNSTASKSFSITVRSPLTINYTLKDWNRGSYYSDYVTVSGGTSPYRWSVSSGSLPTGLRLTYSGTRATVYGTPTRAGTYYFYLKVVDRYNTATTKYLSITIRDPMTVNYTLKDWNKNVYYSDYVTVSGGTAPYRWTVASGSLPTGLRLTYSGTRATVYGTPTREGTYYFTLRAYDRYNSTASKYLYITIRSPLTINYTLRNAAKGTYYSDYVTVSGGRAPYRWSVSSGYLPSGLYLTYSSNRATIYGTPTSAAVTRTFTLRVTDANGSSATKTLTITVPVSLVINYTLRNPTKYEYYSDYVTVSGGTAPYTWSISSGYLPSGLRLSYSGTRATVSGTPLYYGNYGFTLKVRDAYGNTATKYLSFYVYQSSYGTPESAPVADGQGNTSTSLQTTLRVDSEDVVYAGTERDAGLVDVKANAPVRFIIGEWIGTDGKKATVSDVKVFVNGKEDATLEVKDSKFTLPAAKAKGGFSVVVKAQAGTKTLETEELNITALE